MNRVLGAACRRAVVAAGAAVALAGQRRRDPIDGPPRIAARSCRADRDVELP